MNIRQPIIQDDLTLTCPECGEELAGDGENHLECINCNYSIHEIDMRTNDINSYA